MAVTWLWLWDLRALRVKGQTETRPPPPPPPQACAQQAADLSDHRKAHNEEADAAAQGEDRLVRAQVLGELIRDGGHYGLDGGKLQRCQKRGI